MTDSLKENIYYKYTMTLHFINPNKIEEDFYSFNEKKFYFPKLHIITENRYINFIKIHYYCSDRKELTYEIKQNMYEHAMKIMNDRKQNYKQKINKLNDIKEDIKKLINE